MADNAPQLQTAYDLIRGKQYFEARNILLPLLREDKNNADGWWLLANAQTNPKSAQDALKIVLTLNPNHVPAKAMLARLDSPPGTPVDRAQLGDFGDTPFSDLPYPFEGAQSATMPPSMDELLAAPVATPKPFGAAYSSAPFTETTGLPPQAPILPSYQPVEVKKKSANRVLYILLGAAGVLVCMCLACVGIGGAGLTKMLSDPTIQAAFGTVGAMFSLPEKLPATAQDQGAISANQPVQGNVQQLQYNSYTYSGAEGESITISVSPASASSRGSFAVLLGLYDAATGKRIAGNGLFDSLTTKAPANRNQSVGTQETINYTFDRKKDVVILIAGLGANNAYELSVIIR